MLLFIEFSRFSAVFQLRSLSNEYETVTAVHIGDYDVTEKGNGDTISVATWKSDGYSYAIDAEHHPMTAEEMAAVVQSVQ